MLLAFDSKRQSHCGNLTFLVPVGFDARQQLPRGSSRDPQVRIGISSADAVAAAALGFIQRLVRQLHQELESHVGSRDQRCAPDRYCDEAPCGTNFRVGNERGAWVGNSQFLNCVADAFGDVACPIQGRARQQHRELLAPKSSHDIGLPRDPLLQRPGQ